MEMLKGEQNQSRRTLSMESSFKKCVYVYACVCMQADVCQASSRVSQDSPISASQDYWLTDVPPSSFMDFENLSSCRYNKHITH